MWGIFAGTAQDVGLVMGLVGGYLFPGGEREVVERGHLTLGVSLGGHASWLCWVGERRVMGSVVVIGCPDYMGEFVPFSFSFSQILVSCFFF